MKNNVLNRSIVNRLLVRVIPLLVLFMIVLSSVIYVIESGNQESAMKDIGHRATMRTKLALENWIKDQIRVVKMIANDSRIIEAAKNPRDEFAVAEAHAYLKSIHGQFDFYENLPLAVKLDPNDSFEVTVNGKTKTIKNGTFLTDTVSGNTIGKCSPEFSYIKAIYEGKDYFISQVYPSILRGNPIFVISAPVRDENGKLVGVAIVAPQMSYFTEIFVDTIRVGKTGYTFFIDDRGLILAHPQTDYILNKEMVKEIQPITSRVIAEEEEFLETFRGAKKYYVSRRIDLPEDKLLHRWYMVYTQAESEILATSNRFLMILSALGIIVLLLIGVSVYLLSRGMIENPLLKVDRIMNRFKEGDFSMRLNYTAPDEIGRVSGSVDGLADDLQSAIKDINLVMSNVAQGDLSRRVQVGLKGELNDLKDNINNSIDLLEKTIAQVSATSNQVGISAQELALSAQTLADGTSQQAASVEETSSSMNEVESSARQNSENADQAVTLTQNMSNTVSRGDEQMSDMLDSMNLINETSTNISKIIKVIDEIAFQTNLLALNAAVEAARAGKYGKGFAVVADEVRNLAARSAEAAKDTTELIENSVKEVEKGVVKADKTAEILREIKEDVSKVNDMIAEIAAASGEQQKGILEINNGINNVNDVVQKNSSISEETAASSNELSGLARQLNEAMNRFNISEKLKRSEMQFSQMDEASDTRKIPVSTSPGNLPLENKQRKTITLDDSEFGQY